MPESSIVQGIWMDLEETSCNEYIRSSMCSVLVQIKAQIILIHYIISFIYHTCFFCIIQFILFFLSPILTQTKHARGDAGAGNMARWRVSIYPSPICVFD